MKLVRVAAALVPAVAAVDRSGYDMLIQLFTKLEKEASGEKDTHEKKLKDKMKSCAKDADKYADQIETFTENRDKATAAEDEAATALEGAKEDLADATTAHKRASDGLSGLIANYDKQDKRMTYDYNQLTGAVDGVVAALGKVESSDKLAAPTKSKLKYTMNQLKSKMEADAKRLNKEIEDGKTFFEENKKIIQDQIDAADKMMTELNGKITTLEGDFDKAKADKVAAVSDLNGALKAQRENDSNCAAYKATKEAGIKDAAGRIEALKSALSILGETSAHKDFLQEPVSAGFLQMRASGFLAREPRFQRSSLVELINKFGKKTQAGELLSAAVSASPAQVEAFQKIRAEIGTLLNTMHQQQMDDDKAKTWCDDKKNELDLSIETLTNEHKELGLALDAVNAEVTDHKNEVKEATDNINQLRKDAVAAHKKTTEDLQDNQKENEELDLDLTKLKQAAVTLEKTFKSRTESDGAIVLQEVDKVVKDYEAAIVENVAEKRALETGRKNTEEQMATETKNNKQSLKRNTIMLEEKSVKSVDTEDDKRVKKTELATAQRTYDSIFEADDGKCKEYVATYKSREEKRAAESNQLKEARSALQSYMESIGIRM